MLQADMAQRFCSLQASSAPRHSCCHPDSACHYPAPCCCAVTHHRQVDLANAAALGNALLCFLVVPWTLTLVLYTGAELELLPCCWAVGCMLRQRTASRDVQPCANSAPWPSCLRRPALDVPYRPCSGTASAAVCVEVSGAELMP